MQSVMAVERERTSTGVLNVKILISNPAIVYRNQHTADTAAFAVSCPLNDRKCCLRLRHSLFVGQLAGPLAHVIANDFNLQQHSVVVRRVIMNRIGTGNEKKKKKV